MTLANADCDETEIVDTVFPMVPKSVSRDFQRRRLGLSRVEHFNPRELLSCIFRCIGLDALPDDFEFPTFA